MELDGRLRSERGIVGPAPADTQLIATARIAVPRALELLAIAEENVARHGLLNGSLRDEGAPASAHRRGIARTR
jgi:hypothetical protein